MRFICGLFLTITLVFPISACTLNVRSWDFPPQYYQSDQGQWQGLTIALVEVILHQAKCTPVYHSMPWERAQRELQKGNLDIMMNLSKTTARSHFVHFIGPVREEKIRLVTHARLAFKVRELEDIKRLTVPIAIEKGVYYGEAFHRKLTDPQFVEKLVYYSRNDSYLALLEKSRFSGYLGDLYSIKWSFRHNPLHQRFALQPIVVHRNPIFMAASKTSVPQKRVQQLQRAVETAQKRGEIEKVLQA